MDLVWGLGAQFKDIILGMASHLRGDAVPGTISILFFLILAATLVWLGIATSYRIGAVRWMSRLIGESGDGKAFAQEIAPISAKAKEQARSTARKAVEQAWSEYQETLIHHEMDGTMVVSNSVRPSFFFNQEDLHFGPGFWRIIPGLFVTTGLALTFLGLIAALQSLDAQGGVTPERMQELLSIASAKFIMSLSGLVCSIIFTVVLRLRMGGVEKALNDLANKLERRLSFLSLEDLTVRQMRAIQEQREYFRALGMEMVAELGRPLREEVPLAISTSITTAMKPLFDQVGQMSTEGVGAMVKDLSSRFSEDVGRALSQSSDQLSTAGERLAGLADRLNQSSGRMGEEMEAAINRLGQSVDSLRTTMTGSAEQAASALSGGAEAMLAAMTQALEQIKDNTAEGAAEMRQAAEAMRAASEGMHTEIQASAVRASEAVASEMARVSEMAGTSVLQSGHSVAESVANAGGAIAKQMEEVIASLGPSILEPMAGIRVEMQSLVAALEAGVSNFRKLADGVQAGADASQAAAGQFRSSSETLVSAIEPVRSSVMHIENAVRDLREGTRGATEAVTAAARGTAQSASSALEAAERILGAERMAIEASLEGVEALVGSLRGQGERLDSLDEKLGVAFERFAQEVEASVGGMHEHVRKLQQELGPALDTMREVVEQAEQFRPQTR